MRDNVQELYLDHLFRLLEKGNTTVLKASMDDTPAGLIIGQHVMPPSVYDAGRTCIIDEFHVRTPALWESVGKKLLDQMNDHAVQLEAKQFVIINSQTHTPEFDNFLVKEGFTTCSEWWCGQAPGADKAFENLTIRPVISKDIAEVVALSEQKRRAYEEIQPLFWKMAPNANQEPFQYLNDQIDRPDIISLLVEKNHKITGFIIGEIARPQIFYKRTSLCKVDDFMVKEPALWPTVGRLLISKL